MLSLIGVSISLGLSNFAAAIAIGLAGTSARTGVKIALAFGFFEAGMPLLGLAAGARVADLAGEAGRSIAGVLLAGTGAWMVWTVSRRNDGSHRRVEDALPFSQVLLTAFSISVDNLVVGVALSLRHLPVLLAAGTIGVISVVMSLIGLELGKRLGRRVESWSEVFGGAGLVAIGGLLGFGILK